MKLSDNLKKLSSYPFHMPGHKRQSGLSLYGEEIDITEIDGFDNLHSPTGDIKEIEDRLSCLYGSKRSFVSVNGSTCGVLSAISAVGDKGGEIIIAVNCHRSVYNACKLNKLDVYFIEPEYNEELSCWGRVTQKAVDDAVKAHPNACAVVITSPTYEGYVSSIKCSIPLIVDSAHGAHFGFAHWLPERAEGDIVISSLHKTLPSLTQTAVVNVYNEKYADAVKGYMDIFETSSPSYVLLDSVAKCTDFLTNCSSAFENYKILLDDFYKKAERLENITLLHNDDRTRIVISADGYTGTELGAFLRGRGIEPEGTAVKYVILISTVCDSERGFDMLLDALSSLEKRKKKEFSLPKPEVPVKAQGSFSAENTEPTSFSNCAGKVCAEYVFAYPPGSPILAPGQEISRNNAEYITSLLESGVNVLSDSGLLPSKILTKQ